MSTEKKTKSTSVPRPPSLVSQQRQKFADALYECLNPLPWEMIRLMIGYLNFAPRLRQDWKEHEEVDMCRPWMPSQAFAWNEYYLRVAVGATSDTYLTRTGPDAKTWKIDSSIRENFCGMSVLYVDEPRNRLAITTWLHCAEVYTIQDSYFVPSGCSSIVQNFAQFPYVVSLKGDELQFVHLTTGAKAKLASPFVRDSSRFCCTDKFCAFTLTTKEGFATAVGCFATQKVTVLSPGSRVFHYELDMSDRYLVQHRLLFGDGFLAVYRLEDLSLCWTECENVQRLERILDDRVVVTSTEDCEEFHLRDIESGEILSSLRLGALNGIPSIKGHFLVVDGDESDEIYSVFDLDCA